MQYSCKCDVFSLVKNAIKGVKSSKNVAMYFGRIGFRVVKLLLCDYYYYYFCYFINLNSLLLLLLLLLEMYGEPITISITSQTITITLPLLLHLLLLLNHRNTTQVDYKVIFKYLYYFHCISRYHRHITTDNIIINLSGVAVVVEWLACLPVTQKIGVRFYLERESSATSG